MSDLVDEPKQRRPIAIPGRIRRSTLQELREFVEKTKGAPDDAVVTVRTSWWRSGNRHGARLARITAEYRPPATS